MRHPRPWSRGPVAALTLAAAGWGLGTVVSKRAVDEIPPFTLLSVQLAASVAVLAVILALRPSRAQGSIPRRLGLLGLLNPGVAYALSLVGLTQITATLSVLLWAAEPLLILLLASIVLREPLGPRFLVLSGVAVAGMLLVVYEPGTTGSLAGVLLTLAGVACCAVYSVVSRRWIVTLDATAGVVVRQQAYALALALVATIAIAVLGGQVLPTELSMPGLASALVSGVLYYGAAYLLYLAALRRLPASRAASSFYLIPVFGIVGGWLVLGERLAPVQWSGAALVLGAVFLILRVEARTGRVAVVPA